MTLAKDSGGSAARKGGSSSDEYKTIEGNFRSEIKVKGSRFIASSAYAESEGRARDFIDRISGEFHDAAHNCYAFRVGPMEPIYEQFNDHGEPSGTAGMPILNAIRSKGLMNTVVVVTRYFGGIKLGTGGLARAYSAAAADVLEKSGTAVRIIKENLKFTAPVDMVSAVYSNIYLYEGKVVSETYGRKGEFEVMLRLSKIGEFKNALVESTNGKVSFSEDASASWDRSDSDA